MKTLIYALMRALGALAVGLLLVKYRMLTVTWLTIAVGLVFLVSGICSCLSWFFARKRGAGESSEASPTGARQRVRLVPYFPIVGVGSGALGVILSVMPDTFAAYLVTLLSVLIIAGCTTQLYRIAMASRVARIGMFHWIPPLVILAAGTLTLLKPSLMNDPLHVLGWTMMTYGVCDAILSIRLYSITRALIKKDSTPVPNDTDELFGADS